MILPPWRTPLARAIHRHRSLPHSKYVQLATVGSDRRPHNRTIVFRGWLEPDSEMKFVTDLRSQKAQDLLAINSEESWGEVCWYFTKTREQFRIGGTLCLVTGDCSSSDLSKARQDAWAQMSDRGRIQFLWATPGADRSDRGVSFDLAPPSPTSPPIEFCLLLLKPMRVDRLQLQGSPQDRDIYDFDGTNWHTRSVNP